MKTHIIACIIACCFFKFSSAQFFISAQATDLVLMEDLSVTPNSAMIGLTNKIGYYDFFRDLDQYLESSIYIPKTNIYNSDNFKDEYFPDSINITEKVKFFTLGYSARYLLGADYWDTFLLGLSGGIQFGFESVDQQVKDNGAIKTNDFKSKTVGGIWGLSGLYFLNDELVINCDLHYKMPYIELGDDSYFESQTEPALRQGIQISVGVLVYFE